MSEGIDIINMGLEIGMPRVRVKICGIKTVEEANAAVECGVDMLGFNFFRESPRYISPVAAREIIERLPPVISCIGVFVNEKTEEVMKIAYEAMLNGVQLHGDEPPEFCRALTGLRVLKAVRVGEKFDAASIKEYPVSGILLDAGLKGFFGGTGHKFDWRAAVEAKRYAPIILAGGLTIGNVVDAISIVSPSAVDVCSGVEAVPGKKDISKIRRFMAAVERANSMTNQIRGQ